MAVVLDRNVSHILVVIRRVHSVKETSLIVSVVNSKLIEKMSKIDETIGFYRKMSDLQEKLRRR